MQRPRSVPTLFLSCLSKTLLWNVRMSPVLSPFLPTSIVVSVSACSITRIVRVDPPSELPAELPPKLPPQPQARPTVSAAAPIKARTLKALPGLPGRTTSPSLRPRPTSSFLADTRITPFQMLTTSPTTLHHSSDLHASQATRASQAVFVAQQNRALGPREACVVPADRERELSHALLVAARVGIWRVGVAWFGRPPALLLEVGLEREGYSRLRYRSWLDVH